MPLIKKINFYVFFIKNKIKNSQKQPYFVFLKCNFKFFFYNFKSSHVGMKQDYSNHCIIFMHVPKAGGSTLHKIIERQYDKKYIFDTHHNQQQHQKVESLKSIPEEKRKQLKVIKGHMPFGLHEYMSQPCSYITYLRDPVKRIISHYYYVLSNKKHYLYLPVSEKNMSLEDYIDSGLTPELYNHQTRMFSELTKFSHNNFEDCTTQHFEKAKQILEEHFCMVGLTDHFDESLLLLKEQFDWNNVYYFKRKTNKLNPGQKQVSDRIIEKIKDYNQHDIALYAYFRKRFMNILDQQDDEFFKALKWLKTVNNIYSAMLKYPYWVYLKYKGKNN